MKTFEEAEKEHTRRKKLMKTFFTINLACIIIGAISALGLFVAALMYPEMIGEFFGRIVKGFNSIQ